MEFEHQKPVSDDYRSGWERIFRPSRADVDAFEHGRIVSIRQNLYANGCPILENSDAVQER